MESYKKKYSSILVTCMILAIEAGLSKYSLSILNGFEK